jgi:dephospho-CoA kinase
VNTWPGKYVIGLTGNIATGKSVVRRMLEHLGAYGIDADALGHRAISKEAPGYQQVLDVFGSWILNHDSDIDRTKLARVVFINKEALEELEQIIHPLVKQAVDILVRRSKHKIIVIEAIKLLEAGLGKISDSIWVTYAPQDVQMFRLIHKRGLSETAAKNRISSQSSHEIKLGAADVVIHSDKSFEDTWHQVQNAWNATIPTKLRYVQDEVTTIKDQYEVSRAKPDDAANLATFIKTCNNDYAHITPENVMAGFGQKAFLLIRKEKHIFGIMGWQVENLVARVDEIYIDKSLPFNKIVNIMIREIEKASVELLCEVVIIFLPPELAMRDMVWKSLGYEICSIQTLGVRAWQEAAIESLPAGTSMRYKKLREDLILRPV